MSLSCSPYSFDSSWVATFWCVCLRKGNNCYALLLFEAHSLLLSSPSLPKESSIRRLCYYITLPAHWYGSSITQDLRSLSLDLPCNVSYIRILNDPNLKLSYSIPLHPPNLLTIILSTPPLNLLHHKPTDKPSLVLLLPLMSQSKTKTKSTHTIMKHVLPAAFLLLTRLTTIRSGFVRCFLEG